MSEPVPEQLGGFAIEGELGRGGSGVVYAARWDDRPIALKVLLSDDGATAKERDRFLVEAKHMQRVTHPNVVRVLAAGELPDGRPYLAMERLSGSSLAERLLMGRLAIGAALELFQQLTRAISALHAAGVVHRDIKPENIMLVDGGQRAVLLDFGIARGVDDAESTTTQLGMQRGTPAYMAPERFFGARASIGSDVYETAVVLYVMLTGLLPWADQRNPQDRLEPMPPSRRGIELPPGLELVLMRALSPKPEGRPATIDELSAAVARCAWDGETVRGKSQTAPGGRATAYSATTRRVARPALIGGLIVVVAAVTAVITIGVLGSSTRGGAATQVATVATIDGGAVVAAPIDAGMVTTEIVRDAGEAAIAASAIDAGVKRTTSGVRPKPAAPQQVAATPVPAPAAPAATATAKTLPSCAKWVALYCTKDFKETEGTMAGQQCGSMTKMLAQWRGFPADLLDDQERDCATSLPTVTAAINERLRQWRAGVGPGQRNAPVPPTP